jgi:hypothetical protein
MNLPYVFDTSVFDFLDDLLIKLDIVSVSSSSSSVTTHRAHDFDCICPHGVIVHSLPFGNPRLLLVGHDNHPFEYLRSAHPNSLGGSLQV